MRVLLGVHDPALRESLESLLASGGWEFSPAGDEAGLPASGPSLLIVDAAAPGAEPVVPGAPGAARSGGYTIGVVPRADAGAVRRLTESGVDDILTAPFDAAELGIRLVLAEARLRSIPSEAVRLPGQPESADQAAEMVHALRAQEEALRESEGRFRALLDQSSVGFFLCDARLRITHCNEYLSCLINIPLQEIIGADLSNLRNGRLRPYIAAASRGEATFYEGPFRSRNGGSLYALIQYVPLRNEAGEVTGGIGAFADISFRVLGERQLRAQKVEMERINIALHDRTLELEAAMRARSRLYSSMNHELRTPISAILLYQELLIAGSLGPLNEEQLSAIEHSHRATRHLLDLVRDILDLGRIEAGRIKVKPVTVKLVPLLDELQASLSPLAESFGSSLYLELAPDLEPVVTDPKRLRQILMNLVSNAAKFGRRNPIRMRGLRRTNGDTVVEVIDRGIGIPPEEIDRIFEEFVQLSLSDETEQGTGLGLAICRRLADLLGGRVEVESTVDVGSVFRVVLPAVTPSAAPAAGVPVVGVPLV